MKEKIVASGALFTSLIASVCCVGPVVLIALGLGGAGLAASMTQYRPYFISLTFILLGVAFYWTYRKREVKCEDGSCQLRSGSKPMKIALWSITVIAIGSMSFPIWSACLYSSQKAAIIADGEVTKLSIQGMTCAECVMSIEKSVKKIPGVQDVSVSLEDSKASIVTVPGKVSHEDIVNAVKLAGPFEAQVLEKGGTE